MFKPRDLLSYWKSQGMLPAEAIRGEELASFEKRYDVTVPSDLREYLYAANGMRNEPGSDCDQNGFRFWPLDEFKPVPMVCIETQNATPDRPEINRYFAFADYMEWSWAYAIYLGDNGPNVVIHIGVPNPKEVAHSFGEFITRYVADDRRLYVTKEDLLVGPIL
jgi:hypothetical protein